MKVSEIGQFGLIELISSMIQDSRDEHVESWQNLKAGIGDDCAVWSPAPFPHLAKVDCQVQGIHFNLDFISWHDLGWKALAVNLSDIAAMGGLPRYAMVSLGLPDDTRIEDVVSLYAGLIELAKLTGTAVVGGNSSGSPVLFVDVSVIGNINNPEGKYLSRNSAKPGDKIAVTGCLGSAAAGLQILTRKLEIPAKERTELIKAFTCPEPRLKEGLLLVEKGIETGIDISDGLVSDLGHICKASRVEAAVELARLPAGPGIREAFGEQAIEMVLSGGEDYQLLFTGSADRIAAVQQATSYPVTIIGDIIQGKSGNVAVYDQKGTIYQPKTGGWDHFRLRNS